MSIFRIGALDGCVLMGTFTVNMRNIRLHLVKVHIPEDKFFGLECEQSSLFSHRNSLCVEAPLRLCESVTLPSEQTSAPSNIGICSGLLMFPTSYQTVKHHRIAK